MGNASHQIDVANGCTQSLSIGQTDGPLGHNAAQRVHTSADRPDEDTPHVALLGIELIDYTTCEEHADGIDQRENTRHKSVVGICPVKFGANEILPRQRQHLAVEVVDRCGEEQQRTYHPTIGGRFVLIHISVFFVFSIYSVVPAVGLSCLGDIGQCFAALFGDGAPLLACNDLLGE